MTRSRALVLALASFLLPGLGQGIAGRKRPLVGFAVGHLVATVGILLSAWLFVVSFALRCASAIDAWLGLRRVTTVNRELTFVALAIGGATFGMTALSLSAHKIPSSSMYPTLQIGDHIFTDTLTPRFRAIGRGELIVYDQPCYADRQYINRVIAVGGDTVEIRCGVIHLNGTAVPSELVDEQASYEDLDMGGFDGREQWIPRRVSRYRETLDGRSYEIFHDAERPARERTRATLGEPDMKDFPLDDRPRTCAMNHDMDAGGGATNQPPGEIVETKPGAAPCELQRHFKVPPGTLFVLGDNRSNSNDSRFWGVVPVDRVTGRVIGRWLPVSRIGGVE